MTPFEIAKTYIGTVEGPGPADNPVVMEMYASVGHDWVEHDSVAWCAAFVGHCLERAGLRSTRKLNARSYLDWGVPVDLADAQEGDVVIFSRGDPSGWQGHVGFFVRKVGASTIEVLGGNQSDAVNIKRSSTRNLLGVRRAGNVAASVQMPIREVQSRLRGLGYHEVGKADGIIGPRTRAAILAFRDDNSLSLVPIIDVALTDALETPGRARWPQSVPRACRRKAASSPRPTPRSGWERLGRPARSARRSPRRSLRQRGPARWPNAWSASWAWMAGFRPPCHGSARPCSSG